MEVKALEIRDEHTFIPALAVDMNPDRECPGGLTDDEVREALDAANAQHYLLRRCGYPCDGRPNVILTRLSGDGRATNDPYAWGGCRTWANAHSWIIEHWHELKNGDVVDVSFILGETEKPKTSERFSALAEEKP